MSPALSIHKTNIRGTEFRCFQPLCLIKDSAQNEANRVLRCSIRGISTHNHDQTTMLTYKIGFKHGKESEEEIARGVTFYAALFVQKTGLDWPQVQAQARELAEVILAKWPRYYEEMKGRQDISLSEKPFET